VRRVLLDVERDLTHGILKRLDPRGEFSDRGRVLGSRLRAASSSEAALRWPDPALPHVQRLVQRLAHLRANGIFDMTVTAGTAEVKYGPTVREIAARGASN
jgi:hypothetical protein